MYLFIFLSFPLQSHLFNQFCENVNLFFSCQSTDYKVEKKKRKIEYNYQKKI